ncbi:SGE1 protein [Salix suchowensis]|nr:SGE1 protein [Salix suchowensis]
MGIASPPPQTQPPSSPPTASNTDQAAKVNALLNSVVDSIQSTSPPSTTATLVERTSSNQPDRDISPTTRRNRDLAQVLFGDEADSKESPASPPPEPTPVMPSVAPLQSLTNAPPPPQEVASPKPAPTSPLLSPLQQYRNASTPRLPQVRKKLLSCTGLSRCRRKPLPGAQDAPSTFESQREHRNTVHPTLVSSTASVDTIPLRPPSSGSGNYGGPSKISQRFRKFRGTLKAKPHTPAGGEITPYPMDVNEVSPTGQAAVYDPSRLNPPGKTTPSSATDFGRAKVTVPSPPASAGPGIKALWHASGVKRHSNPISKSPTNDPPPTASFLASAYVTIVQSTTCHRRCSRLELSFTPEKEPAPGAESEAIDQLFRAAEALSVDRQALTALLRSASSSSKTTLTRNPSMARAPQPDIPEEQSSSPPQIITSSRPSIDGSRPSEDNSVKKGSIRRHVDALRPPRESLDAPASSIVRRTIILASDTRSSTFDLNTLLRKSSNRRKRASAQSFSNRSVHDRVPTPPPLGRMLHADFLRTHLRQSHTSPDLPLQATILQFQPFPMAPKNPILPLTIHCTLPNLGFCSHLTSSCSYDMYAGDRAQSSAGGNMIPHNCRATRHQLILKLARL